MNRRETAVLARPCRSRVRGTAAVELALTLPLFLTLLGGAFELARLMYLWNSAAEATRLGARVAVVCDVSDTAVVDRVRDLLPMLSAVQVSVTYTPARCTVDTCESVTVSVADGVAVPSIVPFVPLTITLPAVSATLPRESLMSSIGGAANPLCQ